MSSLKIEDIMTVYNRMGMEAEMLKNAKFNKRLHYNILLIIHGGRGGLLIEKGMVEGYGRKASFSNFPAF
jgi:hypothetical protein